VSISDLFKSQAQKQKEAMEEVERAEKIAKTNAVKLAKETKEQSELNLFKKKRQLENRIKQLERERLQLGKQVSDTRDAAFMAAYKAKSKELENHKLALARIGSIETQLRGSTTGLDALGDIVAEALREIDILTTPEETGGMTEDEKMRIELSLTRNSELPSTSGGINLEGLASKIYDDDDDEISDEEALLEIQELLSATKKKKTSSTDDKIKAQLKDIDSKISDLES